MIIFGIGYAGWMSRLVLVDLGAARSSFTLDVYDPDVLILWGASKGRRLTFAAMHTPKEPTHLIRGVITKKERADSSEKRQAPLNFTLALEYYEKREHDALAFKHGLIIPD